MDNKDYYKILGVDKSATDEEIKSAYRKLAKKYHPDISKEENAEEKFKEVQEAYSILGDENKRRQYDQFGSSAFSGGNPFGGGSPFGNGGYSYTTSFDDFDLGDIFGSMFGGSSFFGGRESSRTRAQKGSDVSYQMNLTFDEAVNGCDKDIKLDITTECSKCDGKGGTGEETCKTCHGSGTITQEQRTILGSMLSKTTCPDCKGQGKTYKNTCSECRGTGRVKQNKTFTINIPAGVDTGNRLRLPGKGSGGVNGGPNGDLIIEFNVKDHELFERDGDDIILTIPLTITEAILGCKKIIPTLYGNVKVTIPNGTSTGDKQRIKGKGIDNKAAKRKGDMYIIMDVQIPEVLTREQKELIKQLDKTVFSNKTIEKFNNYVENNS